MLAVSVGTSMLSASSPAADSCVFAVSSTAANSCAAPSLRALLLLLSVSKPSLSVFTPSSRVMEPSLSCAAPSKSVFSAVSSS